MTPPDGTGTGGAGDGASPPGAPFLPRFSDPRDIDEFVAKLEEFERGELSHDAFRAFRLTRGVYGQRQDDVQMLRVKIPQGLVGAEQLEALADIADTYARGLGHVTTRQNVQYHFVKMEHVEAAMRRLDEAGLTMKDACGNTVRNVTACEVAEVCSGAAFDVTPYAEAFTRLYLRHPLSGSLPRKFKAAFSGCASDCAMGHINDLGFLAEVRDGVPGFKVVCAGGLSTTPQAAIVLHEWIPASELPRVGEAILRVFHRLGNRNNKARARLKYVLRKLGEPGFRAVYAEARAEVDAEATAELTLPDVPGRTPAPPVPPPTKRSPGLLAWRAKAVFAQKQPGYVAIYVRLVLGDITSTQMRALAKIVNRFGDGTLRLTIDQNLVIPWVDAKSVAALHAELEAIDLVHAGLRTARDVLSCPGASSCNLAVTSSRALATAIDERLGAADVVDLGEGIGATSIKISGCPNSCGQHHVADLGWHGGAKTIDGVTVPMYQLHLGGGVGPDGARFGKQVVKVPARRVPDAVVTLLRLYQAERTAGETPTTFFRRVDPKRVTSALAELLAPPPRDDETIDIGETTGFVVETKDGECAA